MEKLLQRIPDYKIDAFLTMVGGMFVLGIAIWLLFGFLDIIFNLDTNLEWAMQKLVLILMAPAMMSVTVGILALIGINIKDLVK